MVDPTHEETLREIAAFVKPLLAEHPIREAWVVAKRQGIIVLFDLNGWSHLDLITLETELDQRLQEQYALEASVADLAAHRSRLASLFAVPVEWDS